MEKYNGTNFDTALQEIGSGKKRGCWFWWFVPTPPLINKHGVESGRKTNQIYAIRDAFSIEEENDKVTMYGSLPSSRAYLTSDFLRSKYNEMINEIMKQIKHGKYDVIGEDINKLVSSLTMFYDTANDLDFTRSEGDTTDWRKLADYYDVCLSLAKQAKEARKRRVVGRGASTTAEVVVRATETSEINQPLREFRPVRFGTTTFQYMKGSVVNFGKELIISSAEI